VNVDPFEFLIGLYTIIVGLGISLLVRSIGQMIEGRSRIRLYWVHTAWLALIFMAHVSSWFVLWQYHEVESWSVLECMMLLSVPILLYLVSHLAVPEINELGTERHDMRTFYYGSHRLIQGLLAVAMLVHTLNDALIMDGFAGTPAQMARFAFLAVLLPGVASSRPGVQSFQIVLLLFMAATSSLLFGYRIQ
jgi:hypothetical protein